MVKLDAPLILRGFTILYIMTEKEIWRDVPNYDGYYQASSTGRVKSLDRTLIDKNGRKRFLKGKLIKSYIKKDGYKNICLSKNGVQKILTIPQVIAITFLGHIPNGNKLVVDHRNGIKTDDRLENLRIVTNRANSSTCFRSNKKSFTSKYIGVSFKAKDNNWTSQIVYNGDNIRLGSFSSEIKASNAYQKALSKINDGSFNPNEYTPKFSSKYKGVCLKKPSNRWRSQITINGKQKHLGSFHTELEAHHAYQLALNKQM